MMQIVFVFQSFKFIKNLQSTFFGWTGQGDSRSRIAKTREGVGGVKSFFKESLIIWSATSTYKENHPMMPAVLLHTFEVNRNPWFPILVQQLEGSSRIDRGTYCEITRKFAKGVVS